MSAGFYDVVLATLGARRLMDFGVAMGYGVEGPEFWLAHVPGETQESHIAFAAEDRATVIAFHEAATAAGAETLHAPALHPEYHADYFGAFVRDPDGNNVEAVCHRPE